MLEDIIEDSKKSIGNRVIGRVVMIPNEYTIVVEKFIDEVKVGDEVIVFENSEEIVNPDGFVLGCFTFSKIHLRVVETQELFFFCQDQHSKRESLLSLSLSPLFSDIATNKSMPIDVREQDNMKLILKNPKVSIGDLVKFA